MAKGLTIRTFTGLLALPVWAAAETLAAASTAGGGEALTLSVFAVLIFSAMYHAALALSPRRDAMHAILFMLSLLFALKVTAGQNSSLPWLSFLFDQDLRERFVFIGLLDLPLLMLILQINFPSLLPLRLVNFTVTLSSILGLSTLFLPLALLSRFTESYLVSFLLFYLSLPLIMLMAMNRQSPGNLFWFTAFILVAIAHILDFLVYFGVEHLAALPGIFLLLFAAAVTIRQALLQKTALSQLREYSSQLSGRRNDLEAQLREQNEALKRAHDQILEKKRTLETDLEQERRETVTQALKLMQKKDVTQRMQQELQFLKGKADPEDAERIDRLIKWVKTTNFAMNWDEFEKHFSELHSEFYSRLTDRHPELTPHERRLCAFYRMNMANRDIMLLTDSSYDAVRKANHRLRKKLSISPETDLSNYLSSF